MQQTVEEDPLNPNGYVKHDPKPILLKLEQNAIQNKMKCKFKKNSHKIEFLLPLSDGVNMVDLEVIFERRR